MNFQLPKLDLPKSSSPKAVVIFLFIFFGCIFCSTIVLLSEFPWNGNIIAWFEARDYYDQGNRLNSHHSYAEAEVRYRKAVNIYPKDWRFHLVLGKALIGLRKYKEAEEEFREVVELNPELFDGWLELADCLASQGRDLKGAAEAAHKAIALAPTNAVARAELVYILGRQGKKDEADKELEAAASFEKENGRFWFLSGKYHWGAGDKQRADAEFRQASLLDVTNPEYWEAAGVLLLTEHKSADAVECLARAAKLNPRNALYQNNLGDGQRMNGDMPAAVSAYAKAASLDPKNTEYLLNLGLTQLVTQNYEKAEMNLQKVIEANPGDNRAWKGYINALDLQKKYDKAENFLQKLLSTPEYEKSVATWVYMGNIRFNNGDIKGAEEALSHALSISSDEDEKKQVIQILTRLKEKGAERKPDGAANSNAGKQPDGPADSNAGKQLEGPANSNADKKLDSPIKDKAKKE